MAFRERKEKKRDMVDNCGIIRSSKWNKKFPQREVKIPHVAAGAVRGVSAAR